MYRQQFITVALVAGILAAFEAIVFYKVVVPDAVRAINGIVQQHSHGLPRGLQAVLFELFTREQQITGAHNNTGVMFAILLVIIPLLTSVVLWGTARHSMRGHGRDVLFSVIFIVGSILLYQWLFYFFARKWWYTVPGQSGHDICKHYQEVALQQHFWMT